MRTKDDHMRNGQLKPCYNVQISTANKMIVNYSIGQKTTDTSLYIKHLEGYYDKYGFYPKTDTADAGYGSEENYEYLEAKGIKGFVKYNYFHKEAQRNKRNAANLSKREHYYYNEEKDCFYCPMGQALQNRGTVKQVTKSGYVQHRTVYQASNCETCPMRTVCNKTKANKQITVNENLERHKNIIRERLASEEGLSRRGQRCVDVEGTFGEIKHNKQFRRFLLRGKDKVEIEFGLLALGLNLNRVHKLKQNPMDEVCPIQRKKRQNQQKIALQSATER